MHPSPLPAPWAGQPQPGFGPSALPSALSWEPRMLLLHWRKQIVLLGVHNLAGAREVVCCRKVLSTVVLLPRVASWTSAWSFGSAIQDLTFASGLT